MRNAVDAITDRALELARLAVVRRIITAIAVTFSALLQTFLIQAFVEPASLLPSGFTGVAVLVNQITSLGGVHISTSVGMLLLNIPVAALCWGSISKRFVIFSMMQVGLSSLFLNVFNFAPLLGDKMMLVIFGGFISGLSIAIALKAGASTGGTDFVNRYNRVTLQITTRRPNEVMDAYIEEFQHGISCAEVIGGYSRKTMWLLHAVVSTYESSDIIDLVRDVDPGAVINVFRTDNFVGGWYHGAVDEPLPTAVPDPDKPARLLSKQARRHKQSELQQDDGR